MACATWSPDREGPGTDRRTLVSQTRAGEEQTPDAELRFSDGRSAAKVAKTWRFVDSVLLR